LILFTIFAFLYTDYYACMTCYAKYSKWPNFVVARLEAESFEEFDGRFAVAVCGPNAASRLNFCEVNDEEGGERDAVFLSVFC
jgi:hypothetical protein